ncbi:MAG: Clp protease N-terminal domain-containing protein [Planctomycetota bacterium]|jgi:ATP-dependent Clp protease ATP-binding subunit ClpA
MMSVARQSPATQEILARAEALAGEAGHNEVATSHVAWALALAPSAAQVALLEQNVTDQAIASAIASALGEAGAGAPDSGAPWSRDRTAELGQALEQALDEADVEGAFLIAPVHLFLAITADDRFQAYGVLEAAGAEVERSRRRAAALARDEAQGTLPAVEAFGR